MISTAVLNHWTLEERRVGADLIGVYKMFAIYHKSPSTVRLHFQTTMMDRGHSYLQTREEQNY